MRFENYQFTLRQLQYVVAVAEERSFSRAAERCHVSQPSLSAQVAELEGALRVQLFERDRRGVLLTPPGEELLARARAVLLAASDLGEAATRLVNPLVGTLRLGVIPTVGPYLLADLVPHLAAEFPELEVRWTEDKTPELMKQLRSGELDAALLALESDLGDVERATVLTDDFVVACAPAHRLAASTAPLLASELAGEQVLVLADGHCFGDQAVNLCALAHAGAHTFRATSLSTLAQMASAQVAVTILPRLAVEIENRRASLVIVPFAAPAPHRTIAFVWRPGSPVSVAMRTLAGAARRALGSAASDRSIRG